MSYNSGNSAREFAVETNFQRMACRPGGIPGAQALRNAKKEVLRLFIRCSRPVREKGAGHAAATLAAGRLVFAGIGRKVRLSRTASA